MSLILDALRKSEAERRRGRAPDLFASLPAPAAPGRLGLLRFWPWPVGLVVLLGASYLLWPRQQPAPAPSKAATAGADADASPASPARENTGASAPAMAAADRPERTASAAAFAPPPVTRPGLRPAPGATGPSPATARRPTAIASPLPLPPATSASESIALAAPPAASADDDAAESLPPIAVLDASARAALPALKLSMHVWNSEPGKRFAIIDGQRVTEGSTVGSGLIGEIRRDGVVLIVSGRRVLLPRP